MDNQTPPATNPADFDFIMQQPSTPAPKKFNKKLLILAVLVICAIAAVALSLMTPKKTSQVSTQTQLDAQKLVTDFMAAAQKQDVGEVSKFFTQADYRTSTYIENQVIKPLTAYTLASCTYSLPAQQKVVGATAVVAACPTKKTGKKVEFNFSTVKTSDGQKINSVQVGRAS